MYVSPIQGMYQEWYSKRIFSSFYYTFHSLCNSTCSKGTKQFVPFAYTTTRMNRSAVLVTLLGTQALTLMSLFVWMAIFSMYHQAGRIWENSNTVFLLYPLLPLSLSGYAWVMFRVKKYRNALIASSIPALISFSLLTYFYIVGLTS